LVPGAATAADGAQAVALFVEFLLHVAEEVLDGWVSERGAFEMGYLRGGREGAEAM